MLLLVGLGNPGPNHAGDRHNIGFMAVDAVVERHGFGPWRQRFLGECAEGHVAGEKVLALKPMTYMNRSGQSVQAAGAFYKLPVEDILVMHDEIDLAFCKLRVKRGGGAAGHNGIRDLDRHVGPDYRRVRIGVGHPGDRGRVHGHVLKRFSKDESARVERLLEAVAEHFPLLVNGDDGGFMSRIALVMNPPKPKPHDDDPEPTPPVDRGISEDGV